MASPRNGCVLKPLRCLSAPQRARPLQISKVQSLSEFLEEWLALQKDWSRLHNPPRNDMTATIEPANVAPCPVHQHEGKNGGSIFASKTVWMCKKQSDRECLGDGHNPECPVAVASAVRFYSIPKHHDHPEVYDLVSRALESLGGWVEDCTDRVIQLKPLQSQQSNPRRQSQTTPGAANAPSFNPPRHSLWNLQWNWSSKAPVVHSDLLVWQRVNHYPGAKNITRKDLLKKHLGRYQTLHPLGTRGSALFRIMPTTFVLPKEYPRFVDAFNSAANGEEPTVPQPSGLNLWIMKPVGSSRGRGISIVQHPHQASLEAPVVLQRYVTSPLLIEGYKFDLRLYVLATSFNPLEAYLYREGFARFAAEKYSLETAQLGNTLVHLTNSSIQIMEGGKGSGCPPDGDGRLGANSNKWSLARLWKTLRAHGIDEDALWMRIKHVVVAVLFSTQDAIPHQVSAQPEDAASGKDAQIGRHPRRCRGGGGGGWGVER